MDTDTCITNFPTSDEFKCDNAEDWLKADDKDAFLFNLTMNPQRDPDKKSTRKPGKTKSERPRDGKEDQRYLSLLENEKKRRKALDVDIQILKECRQKLSLEGGGRMQRRRKRKRKRTQKRRRKKRKRRTRR